MIDLTSSTFASGGEIPVKHATRTVSGGLNVSIPYTWSDPPSGTKSLALALVDRESFANNWVHWLVVDIPPSSRALAEGASETTAMPQGSRELDNTFRTSGYGGPQPPPGSGRHPYEATIYALDVAALDLAQSASLSAFEARIQGHVLAQSSITGRLGR